VNPNVTTTFVLLSDWCDPAKQAAAFKTMQDAGVDVITQHQDCTKTIVEAAERAGILVTGYHFDGSASAPNGWLTGAAWNWGPVYTELVQQIMAGTYHTNVMFAGLEAGWVKLAPFGKSVSPETQKQINETVEGLRAGKIMPFTGPIKDQSGAVKISGASPSDTDLQKIDWLVEGVIGSTK
jgi:basic membrane lipoprotein Med (substrate-binding protein (PBP1-ABC) superfamily)